MGINLINYLTYL